MSTSTPGRELMRALKQAAGNPGPCLCLKVGEPALAWLRPVATQAGRQVPEDVARLTEWRNANVDAFLTQFTATPARTSAWLASTIASDDRRILFMIDDRSGRTVGYMGLAYIDWEASYGEADSIVKGLPTEKGLATQAIETLIGWARGSLGLANIGVRVRSDNPAIEFYRRTGFVELRRTPLVSSEHDGEISWRESDAGGPAPIHLVHMRHTR